LNLDIEIINLLSYHNKRKIADKLYKTKFAELEPIIKQRLKNGAEIMFDEDVQFLLDKDEKLIFRKVK